MSLFANHENLQGLHIDLEKNPNDPEAWCKMALAIQDYESNDRSSNNWQQEISQGYDVESAKSLNSKPSVDAEHQARMDCSRLALLHALELRPEHADCCLQIARGLLSLGLLSPAIAALQRCIGLDPRVINAHELLASTYLSSGRFQAAADCMLHGVESNPQAVRLRVLFARALRQLKRVEEALEHAVCGTELDPEDRAAGVEWAELLGQLGRDQECLSAWKKLTHQHQDSCGIARSYGEALLHCRQYEEAAKVFASLVDRCPESTEVRLQLGLALCELGKIEAAQQYACWALRVDEHNALAHYLQARCYEQQKLEEDAIESYRRAVQIDSKLADAFHRLGMLLFRMGDTRAAQRALVQATANAPEDERIARDLRSVLRRSTGTFFKRPDLLVQESAFAGNLSQFSVDEALEFLRNQRASGDFRVRTQSGQAFLRLRNGLIIRATSSRCPRLPELLLVRGYLSSEDLESFTRGEDRIASAEELELRLVSSQKLSRSQIDELLFKQIREIVADLIDWSEGNFEFRRVDVSSDPSEAAQDPAAVLLDVYRIRDEARQAGR